MASEEIKCENCKYKHRHRHHQQRSRGNGNGITIDTIIISDEYYFCLCIFNHFLRTNLLFIAAHLITLFTIANHM